MGNLRSQPALANCADGRLRWDLLTTMAPEAVASQGRSVFMTKEEFCHYAASTLNETREWAEVEWQVMAIDTNMSKKTINEGVLAGQLLIEVEVSA